LETRRYEVLVNTTQTLSSANAIMNTVTPGFLRELGVILQRPGAGRSLSTLDAKDGCEHDYLCDPSCGEEDDGSDYRDEHHSAGWHFPDVSSGSSTTNAFRFVDYRICFFINEHGRGHGEILGLAYINGYNMIVATGHTSVLNTTAHEIGHLLGADDAVCIDGQPCVMSWSNRYRHLHDVWCNRCWFDILIINR
jgi:hypothetical protein